MSLSLAIPLALSTILIIVIAKWAYQILQKLWLRPKKLEKHLRELGFDGNPYKFVFGDMKEFGKMRVEAKSKPIKLLDDIRPRVLPFHHQIIKKYGDNSFIWFGAKPRLNIMDPKLVKEVYSRPHEFHKPHPDPVADLVVGGLLAAHGKKWSKHRKIINPAFHVDKLKSMVPALSLSCDYMIKKWDALVPKNGSAEIDVWPYFEDLSGDMISGAAFGSNIEEGRIIFQLHKEQTDLGFKMMGSTYTAPFRPSFWPPKFDERMIQIENEIQARIKKIIQKRENCTKTGQGNVDDLLSILLRANSKDIQQDDEEMRLSMEEVVDECKVFYTAGANSTSRLIVWTMIMLSAHPDWQTRAREEVLQLLGNNKTLDFESLNQLKIVTMILKEVLRLYPPTSMAIRAVSKATKLGNITIPPWVQLTLPIILHQYDPRTWGNDATQFKPERFSEGAKVPSSFSPFSGGPRICIGHNFAMLEAKIAIATMLQHYSFELSTSYVHAPELFFLLRPQYGAKLVLHKLN